MNNEIEKHGFAFVPSVSGKGEQYELISILGPISGAGRRGLLGLPAVAELARSPGLLNLVRPHLPSEPLPVRGIYFDKSAEGNWLVPWHQDLTIAVRSSAEEKQIGNVNNWPQLSTNDYVRVPESQTTAAVALLEDVPFVPLEPEQAAVFAANLPTTTRTDLQPYLVRGASFTTHPLYTTVQYDADTGRLLVRQATYNGEMLWPYRSAADPNALVVLLPQAPKQVYPLALLGGDGIFGSTKNPDMR